MNRTQRQKRHHYLPRAYLGAWSDENGRVAGRLRPSPKPFISSTLNVAVEADLYSIETAGVIDDSIEGELAEVDSALPGLLDMLRNRRAPRRGSQDRRMLSQLLAIQFARTPEHLERALFSHRARDATGECPITYGAMARFLNDEHGELPQDREIQAALDFANYELRRVRSTKADALGVVFSVALGRVAPRFEAMGWHIEICHRTRFITTDRPLALWTTRPRYGNLGGIGIEDAQEIRFPIGPHHMLVLHRRRGDDRYVVDEARVVAVNAHLAGSCYKLLIGHRLDADLLGSFNLRSRRPALRFNSGPMLIVDGSGREIATGDEILHLYVPQG